MSATVLSRSSIAAGRSKAEAPPGAEPPRGGRRTLPPPATRPPSGSSALPGPAKLLSEGEADRPGARGSPREPPRASEEPSSPRDPDPRILSAPLDPPRRPGEPDRLEGRDGERKRPDPKSQSFSRSYGSVLPTSLTYVLLSARGFSPRRPAAVMSTAGRENDSLPSIFKGRRERTERFET